MRWSRPVEGTPKTVTISREADGWYVCISCAEVPYAVVAERTGQETGIDLGLESFATLSDGTRIHHPRCYRVPSAVSKRPNAACRAARRGANRPPQEGGQVAGEGASGGQTPANRSPAQNRVAARSAARRNLSRRLADGQHAPEPPSRQEHQRCGLVAVLAHPELKAACAGRPVVAVPPAYTSQTCSGCGVVVSKGLSVRWHACPDCGTSLHRDHNAAKNIERRGQRLRGGVALATS